MTAQWTWHGGGLAAARRHFGEGDWLDLSTGINPQPWPATGELDIDWQRLPEPEALTALEHVAAAYFGTAPEHVCAVPGTEIGLRLVGRLIGGEARHVAPTYSTHGEMIARSTAITADALRSTTGTRIVANPVNPDGRTFDPAELLAGAEDWLLVDEAFADCDPAFSLAAKVEDGRKLVVFRSFGKFFGLAGVRLGFVLAPRVILAPLRALLGAWPLSSGALAIGTEAYGDSAWIAATRLRLRADAAALDAVLGMLAYEPIGDCPLFRLIAVDDAACLFERLARQAILTRPFADHPRWLRIGLPAEAAGRDRLQAALRG